MSSNILLEKWKSDIVTGDREANKPEMVIFNKCIDAINLLHKHIKLNSKIAIHGDVDLDGIGSTYIVKRTLDYHNATNQVLLINKDKEHGIKQKHVEFFKNYKIDLLIILDSSSNEIELIKQFNCDVLVVDHHEILHNELIGKTNDNEHNFVIVNNTIKNIDFDLNMNWLISKNKNAFENISEYKETVDMSCGLVIYELLRVYCNCFSNEDIIENLMLYQWVGVTLFTDAINLLNERNQWYIGKTVSNMQVETSLKIILNQLDSYKQTLSKSYIDYKFAPLINKAIRAGAGSEAMNICINRPQDIHELDKYAKIQEEVINKAINENEVFKGDYICKNIGELGIHKNYCGVIASRLCGDQKKNSAVYIMIDGKAKGSFRGLHDKIDYRSYFANYKEEIYAQGHKPAFGFELELNDLVSIMAQLKSIEPTQSDRFFLTAGQVDDSDKGIYHIENFEEFKRQGYLWRLAIGNSRVASRDEINIIVSSKDITLIEVRGKLYMYDVLGLECKAFKPIQDRLVRIYAEYNNSVNLYLKPL